jgi:hypothetical protein
MGCEDLPGAGPSKRKSRNPGRRSGWWPLKISGLQWHSLCVSGPSSPRLGIFSHESGLRRSARIRSQGPQRSAAFIGGLLYKVSPELEKLWRLCGVPCWLRSPTHGFRTCTPALSKSTSGPWPSHACFHVTVSLARNKRRRIATETSILPVTSARRDWLSCYPETPCLLF